MSNLNDPRVLFAAERTLLAWNRTSLALIAFGFLIERSGLLMQVLAPSHLQNSSTILTFAIGLTFTMTGAISAIYSSKQYLKALATLSSEEFPDGYRTMWGVYLNYITATLGLALMVALTLGNLSS